MVSDELVRKIYDMKLGPRKQKRSFIARHPRIAHRAVMITKDEKLADFYIKMFGENPKGFSGSREKVERFVYDVMRWRKEGKERKRLWMSSPEYPMLQLSGEEEEEFLRIYR